MLIWDIDADGVSEGDYQGIYLLANYSTLDLQVAYPTLPNIKSEHVGHLVVDNSVPSVVIDPNGDIDYKNSANPLVTVDDHNGSGIGSRYYVWKEDGVAVESGDWISFNTNSKYLPKNTGNGDFVLWIKASDLSGNTLTLSSSSFKIDTTAPQPVYATNGNSDYELEATTVVDVTDNLAGIDTTSYAWSSSNDDLSVSTWTAFTTGANITTTTDVTGTYYLHVKTLDLATNTENFVSNPFYSDNTGPVAYISEAVSDSISAITVLATTTDVHAGMHTTASYDYYSVATGWVGRSTESSHQFTSLATNL